MKTLIVNINIEYDSPKRDQDTIEHRGFWQCDDMRCYGKPTSHKSHLQPHATSEQEQLHMCIGFMTQKKT